MKKARLKIHGKRAAIGLGLLLLVALALAALTNRSDFFRGTNRLAALPQPDLSAVEPQVAEKIRDARARVLEAPKSYEAWSKLAMVLDVHDFKNAAIPCYEQALKLKPDAFRYAYYYAVALSETGSATALEWFERCLALRPDYAPLRVLYGRALYEAGQLVEAEDAFRKAIGARFENAHAYLGLGQIYLARNQLDSSKVYLTRAIELDPQYGEAHGLLAEVHRRAGQPEKAAIELQIAERLPKVTPLADPIYEELIAEGVSSFWYRDRGLIHQAKGDIAAAIDEFKMALRLKPDPEGHKYVADLLQEQGRSEEALAYYRQAVSLSPRYADAYAAGARTLHKLGRVAEARMWLDKALRTDPGFVDAYLTLSEFHIQAGDEAKAVATLHRGLQTTQGSLPLAVRLAWVRATSASDEIRNGAEALRIAKAACEQTHYREPDALNTLAAAYAETGNFEMAIKLAGEARDLATAARRETLAQNIQMHLQSYRNKRPFRR